MLSANFRIHQVVKRYLGLGIVVIGLVYHGVVEIPPQLRGRLATSNLANQVYVASLVVRLLDVP